MEPNIENQIPQTNNQESIQVDQDQEPQGIFKEKESKVGPIVGSIIVIIIIVIGGLYFWSTLVEEKQEEIQQGAGQELLDSAENDKVNGVPQRTSGESGVSSVSEIDADLNSVNVDSLGSGEIDAIDAEFEGI